MTGNDDFVFAIAGLEDEPEIRRLVGATPMPGPITLRFEREPDYFLGCTVMGDICDVFIARHAADGELAGVLCRTERRAFVNGTETTIGGIGQVRIAPAFRGQGLLERGWPLFERRDLIYTGVIARDNPRALRALVGRAPGAPTVVRVGGLTTLGLMVKKRRPRTPPDGLRLERASADLLEELVDFLRREASRRQFAPAYRPDDFTAGRLLRDLAIGDVIVAKRGGAIVGTVAYWDQRRYKQDIVEQYGSTLRRARPVYDLAAAAFGIPRLPGPGEEIGTVFCSLVCVGDDDPETFDALLSECLAESSRRGSAWLMVGLADTDPLLGVARRRLHVTYHADIFAAAWGGADLATRLDGRCPYVEIATL